MKCLTEEVILGLSVILCTAHLAVYQAPHTACACGRTYIMIDGTDLECEPVPLSASEENQHPSLMGCRLALGYGGEGRICPGFVLETVQKSPVFVGQVLYH